jgi:hypothetical protein
VNELERRVGKALAVGAPTFVRTMPNGTIGQVRVRQALISVVTLGFVVGSVLGAFNLLSAVPRAAHEPGSWQTEAPPPQGELPSPQGQADGITDSTAFPIPSDTAREDTTATSVNSSNPYTDQVEGQELYLITQKHVVAHGHVRGIEWSLAAYDTRPFAEYLGGPCGDLYVGDMGDYGGIEFCLHTNETPPDGQFALAGFGNNYDPIAGPITGYAGLVGRRVSTVELRLVDGTTSELTLYDAPSGIDARYFAVFVDKATAGTIVAIGSDGTAIDRERLCVGRVPEAPDNVGCGHGLLALSSIVTTDPLELGVDP